MGDAARAPKPARYLVSFVDADGVARTERRTASSARLLLRGLEQEGSTGIVLHDDDMTAQLKDVDPAIRDLASADQELSSVYDAAHDVEGKLECLRRAYETAGPDTTTHIDYALALVAEGCDPQEARRVLESRCPVTLTPAARIFTGWTRALIALEGGQHRQAADLFRLVVDEVEAIYEPATWEAVKTTMKTGLGRALAHLGDPGGRPLLTNAMPFVVASADRRLLERCQAALALYDQAPRAS